MSGREDERIEVRPEHFDRAAQSPLTAPLSAYERGMIADVGATLRLRARQCRAAAAAAEGAGRLGDAWLRRQESAEAERAAEVLARLHAGSFWPLLPGWSQRLGEPARAEPIPVPPSPSCLPPASDPDADPAGR